MSDQTIINNTPVTPDSSAVSPLESFHNELAVPAVNNAPVQEATPAAESVSSGAQPAVPSADAPDLTQQLATPDPLANGSASAGASSSSTPGNRAEQPAAAVSTDAVSQDLNASVKDFVQAFNFVEAGVEKLGAAAKDELITLARKYL